MTNMLLKHLMDAAVFSLLGLVVFTLAFVLVDKLTPGDLRREIVEQKNLPLAVVLAAFIVAIAIIISAAIQG